MTQHQVTSDTTLDRFCVTEAGANYVFRKLDQVDREVGTPIDAVPFWSGFLSQWNLASFRLNNILYPTAEHYMMAAKARVFGDTEALQKILNAQWPKAAKEIGRSVKGYDDEIWGQVRYFHVVLGNFAKFTSSDVLKNYLLSTGSKILVEASPADQIWGVVLQEKDPAVYRPSLWNGRNLLGFALMGVRSLLRQGTMVG